MSGGEERKLVLHSIDFNHTYAINYPCAIWGLNLMGISAQITVIGEDGYLRVFTTDEANIKNIDVHQNFMDNQ